jgi:hypothetical protein
MKMLNGLSLQIFEKAVMNLRFHNRQELLDYWLKNEMYVFVFRVIGGTFRLNLSLPVT